MRCAEVVAIQNSQVTHRARCLFCFAYHYNLNNEATDKAPPNIALRFRLLWQDYFD